MASNGNALRAGSLIIACCAIALGVVIVVSGPDRFAAKQDYVARFKLDQNLSGLRAGDGVRLGGVPIGSVSDVRIIDDPADPRIDVTMRLPKKYTFHAGATVAIDAFLGSPALNIDNLGSGAPMGPNDVFAGSPGLFTKIGQIVPKVSGVVDDVGKIAPTLDAAIAEFQGLAADARKKNLSQISDVANQAKELLMAVRAKVDPMVEKYNAVADETRQAAKNIGDFVGPSTGPATTDFHQILADFRQTTGRLGPVADKVTHALDSINSQLDKLQETSANLQATIANTKDLTADVKSILVDNRPRIDRIIASVEGTANNAKAFTAEVLHRPSRLIWKDDEKTQGNLNVYFTAREFSEGAAELNDAAATLRDAVRDPRLTSDDLKQRIQLLNAAFDRFAEVQERLYKSIK